MSRYIDAEWLSKLFPDTGEGEWTYNATALGYINSAPTIDLVRCGECRWFDRKYKHHGECMCYSNQYNGRHEDDFCSMAKHRSSGNRTSRKSRQVQRGVANDGNLEK